VKRLLQSEKTTNHLQLQAKLETEM